METKICTKCQQDKPLDAYGPRRKGLNTYCRPCRAEYNKEHRKKNPGVEKYARIKYLYNLSKEEYEQMWELQGKVCAICKETPSQPHVDHDHLTGKVRKILCANYNRMLGQAKDNINVLEKAIDYLKEHA